MSFNLLHTFRAKSCIKNSHWYRETLYCDICKEPIAFRYIIDGKVGIHVFYKYRKFKQEINDRKDTHLVKGEFIPEIDYVEFDEFINEVKSKIDNICKLEEIDIEDEIEREEDFEEDPSEGEDMGDSDDEPDNILYYI